MESNQQIQQPSPTPLQFTQTQSTSTPLVHPKSSNLSIVLLALVSFFSLTGFIYFYLQTQTLKGELSAQSTPTTALADTQSSPTVDPVAGWQTYSHEQLPVNFRYPANLFTNINNGELQQGLLLIYLDSHAVTVPEAYGGDLTAIEIRYVMPDNSLDRSMTRTYDEQLASYKQQVTLNSLRITQLDFSDKNLSGVTIQGIRVEGYMGGEPLVATLIKLPQGYLTLTFNQQIATKSAIDLETYNQILSTFQVNVSQ